MWGPGAPSEPLGPNHLHQLLPPLDGAANWRSVATDNKRASSELLYRPPHALSLLSRSALGISRVSVFTVSLSKDSATTTACHASTVR
jgi:hypothetical protein